MLRLAFTFLVLIAYGSLYPFSDWRPAPAPALAFLFALPGHVDRADAVQNIRAKLAQVTSDVDQTESVANATAH